MPTEARKVSTRLRLHHSPEVTVKTSGSCCLWKQVVLPIFFSKWRWGRSKNELGAPGKILLGRALTHWKSSPSSRSHHVNMWVLTQTLTGCGSFPIDLSWALASISFQRGHKYYLINKGRTFLMDASGILNTHRQLRILNVSVFHSGINFYCVADRHKKKKR